MSRYKCCLLPVVLLLITFLQLFEAEAKSGPNILLILTDDQGYHDVSYYGTEDIRTPNIDELVTFGMRLDDFYTNSPDFFPTRAATMTSQYRQGNRCLESDGRDNPLFFTRREGGMR